MSELEFRQVEYPHCADSLDHGLARRNRVLRLLALIEHPSALPADVGIAHRPRAPVAHRGNAEGA